MKRTDFKEDSSVFLISKGLIVVAILITSSLSFILGYFVGKSVQPPISNQTSLIPQQDIPEQKDIVAQQPEQTKQIQEIVATEQAQENQQTIGTQKTQETQQAQKTKGALESNKTAGAKEPKKLTKKRKYTVQAGAFRNVSDANALKERLDKKGYKACIIPSETKKHETLYKVNIGEFANRKDADLLSVKIRKSEGLQTFVTFKVEQGVLR